MQCRQSKPLDKSQALKWISSAYSRTAALSDSAGHTRDYLQAKVWCRLALGGAHPLCLDQIALRESSHFAMVMQCRNSSGFIGPYVKVHAARQGGRIRCIRVERRTPGRLFNNIIEYRPGCGGVADNSFAAAPLFVGFLVRVQGCSALGAPYPEVK